MGSSCPRYFPSSSGDFGGVSIYLIISTTVPQIPVLMLHPEFGMRSIHHDLCPKTDFLIPQFPLTEEGGYFRFWDSSQSFDFYLLPSPVRRFVRAPICPCTPFFTHLVTKYKHLLISILTWICYLRNWPRFLFQWSVLGLLIQIRRNSSNPPTSPLSVGDHVTLVWKWNKYQLLIKITEFW